jgi:hypothetical protein
VQARVFPKTRAKPEARKKPRRHPKDEAEAAALSPRMRILFIVPDLGLCGIFAQNFHPVSSDPVSVFRPA